MTSSDSFNLNKQAMSSPATSPIPGSYGLPLIGPFLDRINFFYREGEVDFLKARCERYNSTVYKVNFSPGPPGFPDSKGVMLLDQKSFPVLFDNAKVDKRDTFVGPYAPDKAYTGGYRVLAYLDTHEPLHAALKEYLFEVMRACGPRFLPEFRSSFVKGFEKMEADKEFDPKSYLDQIAFEFMLKSILQVDPSLELGKDGISLVNTWVAAQFAPTSPAGITGLPAVVEDLILREFPIPYFLVKKKHERLSDFFRKHSAELLDMAVDKFKLEREEALHNLVFMTILNGFLGFSRLFPSLVYYTSSMRTDLRDQLKKEIRTAINKDTGKGFMSAVKEMQLLNSTVVEVLRLAPPVLYQYGRARKDFVVETHDSAFMIKKGTLLGGSQALVCRDPRVFIDPDKFVPHRFVGEEGEKLLANVFWSNGRETDSTSADNKQCAGKEFVVTIAKAFLVQLFLRYDSIELTDGSKPGKFKIKLMNKAVP